MNTAYLQTLKKYTSQVLTNKYLSILILLIIKFLVQLSVLRSGFMWLSADDYCRTVKSYEWLQHPNLYAGVWLSGHFWINGIVMYFVKDLFLAVLFVNVIFSALSLIYFYKIVDLVFDKKIAFFSALIFSVFQFQVWLSISGLPEPIFFFFIIGGIYYFLVWKKTGGIFSLFLSAVFFAGGNLFRYEGWIFSGVFVFLVIVKHRRNIIDFNHYLIRDVLIATISFITIVFWIVLNYIDYKDPFFFAKETSRIYEEYNTVKFLQRLIQYPIFIFYIAPITTLFSLKVVWHTIKNFISKEKKIDTIVSYFLLFNVLELVLLIIQGILGTGGTNIISRYIVINSLLFIPFAVYQIFQFRKLNTVTLLFGVSLINLIWCYYYPHAFRDDTYETGKLLRDYITKTNLTPNEKIYFQEVEGFYDVFAVQTLSNHPSVFLFHGFPTKVVKKTKGGIKTEVEETNVLDIRNFLQKNKIAIAVVKSDNYAEKLKKMNFKNEEIGDYKIFYVKGIESPMKDTSLVLLSSDVDSLTENSDIISFGKLFTIENYFVDNTNFGFNPQTVTINWKSVDRYILDSIEYNTYEFERYWATLELKSATTDSIVYSVSRKIFSNMNVESLLESNRMRNIIVLEPFAILFYSKRFSISPFESGIYNLVLKVYDKKYNRDLPLFRGLKYYLPEKSEKTLLNLRDSIKITTKNPKDKKDTLVVEYVLGNIIAMFPDVDIKKLAKTNLDIYNIITRNGLQVFFSQRYQADHFLDFIFSNF